MIFNEHIKRFVALLIDSLFINFTFSLAIGFILPFEEMNSLISIGYELVSFLIYFIMFDFVNHGQTLGKLCLGVKGNKEDLNDRVSRSFLKILAILIFPITVFYYIFYGKIIHDLLFNRLIKITPYK